MKEILFVRHAETDMAGTFCDHSDPELNARGLIQLNELISRLRAEKVDAVYTSDLRRAYATGRAIAKAFGIDCHARSALREIGFGQWEGLTWKEIERRDETYARRWLAEYPNLPTQAGENFRDFEQRVLEEVDSLSKKIEAEHQCIVVVTHAGVLRTVLRVLDGCSEKETWERTKPYCSLVRHPIAVSPSVQTSGVGA
jgi:alpha-ribazole phosphatase